MKQTIVKTCCLLGMSVGLLACHATPTEQKPVAGELATAGVQPPTVSTPQAVTQIIVRLKQGADGKPLPFSDALLQSLASTAGMPLLYVRPMSGDAHVLKPATPVSPQTLVAITKQLSQHPSVQYAEPDKIMTAR